MRKSSINGGFSHVWLLEGRENARNVYKFALWMEMVVGLLTQDWWFSWVYSYMTWPDRGWKMLEDEFPHYYLLKSCYFQGLCPFTKGTKWHDPPWFWACSSTVGSRRPRSVLCHPCRGLKLGIFHGFQHFSLKNWRWMEIWAVWPKSLLLDDCRWWYYPTFWGL